MNSYPTFGTHSSFFYYSLEHLYVNMFNYIQNGIENNQLVYISISPEIHKNFVNVLSSNGIDSTNIIFKPFTDLLLLYSSKGFKELNLTIDEMILDAVNKGFSGITLIGQASYAIGLTSKPTFLNFEKILNPLFHNKNASALCLYDLYDNFHEKEYIDDDVLRESLTSHSNIFSKFKFINTEDFK